MIKKKSLKTIASSLLLTLFVIQFIPLNRINPPETSPISAPGEVIAVLQKSCFDCHSHHTKWTRPAYMAPISWAISAKISQARRSLNFSQWNNAGATDDKARIEAIRKTVLSADQHQQLYYIANPQARLTAGERDLLLNWIENFQREQQTEFKNSGNTPPGKRL
jgi:hypothetical protein